MFFLSFMPQDFMPCVIFQLFSFRYPYVLNRHCSARKFTKVCEVVVISFFLAIHEGYFCPIFKSISWRDLRSNMIIFLHWNILFTKIFNKCVKTQFWTSRGRHVDVTASHCLPWQVKRTKVENLIFLTQIQMFWTSKSRKSETVHKLIFNP